MTNSITNRQMVFILFLTLTSVTIITIPKVMAESAGVGNWITIMVTAVLFGILAAVIARLNSIFRGKMLFDYSRELVGKVGAAVFAIIYALYFLMATVYLCTSMAGMLEANFLVKTPLWAFWAIGLPVFGYMAYKGVASVARVAEIYGVFYIFAVAVVHILMIVQGDVVNILPLVVPSEMGRYFTAVKTAIVSFLGIEVLTALPFSKERSEKAPRVAFLALLGIGLVYVLVVESSIMMVGIHEIKYNNYALITAFRQIVLRYIEFLRRIDVLYLTTGLSGIFAGIAVAYLAMVEYVCRLFPKAGRLVIVCIAGAAIFLLSWMGSGTADFQDAIGWYITYAGLAAAGLIPLLLRVIARVKKHV